MAADTNPRAGLDAGRRGDRAGKCSAVVVDLGETVGAIVSRNSMEVPELVSLDDTALVTWS